MSEKKEFYFNFEIFSFKAIDRPDLCKQYIDGHTNLLKEHGITKLTSSDKKWCSNPDSYVLFVKDILTNEIIAGARLDIKNENYSLPIEDAISDKDKQIYNFALKKMEDGGVGEICGLWICKKYLGLGLAVILLRADLSLAIPLNVKTLLFLCSDNTKNMLNNMGCVVEPSIGNNGTFYYPKFDLIATVMVLSDMKKMKNAKPQDRERILSLGINPNQNFVEITPNAEMNVNYFLECEKSTPNQASRC